MLAEIDMLSAFIAVIAGFVAIIAIASIFAIEWVKDKTKPIEELLTRELKLNPVSEYSLNAFADIAVEMQSTLEIHTGLIHQLVSVSSVGDKMPGLAAENRKLRDRLEKAMQELMLISNITTRRRSAIQQLSQTIGDQYSLDKMKEVAKLFPGDSNFASGIRELSNRLAPS